MAKQAKAKQVEVAPQEAVQTIMAAPVKPSKPEWEIKDRVYYLKGNKRPLTLTIPGRHTRKHALLYFDLKTGISFFKKLILIVVVIINPIIPSSIASFI